MDDSCESLLDPIESIIYCYLYIHIRFKRALTMRDKTALVSGYARSFVSGEYLVDATITVLEDDKLKFKTDSSGKFGPFEWGVDQPITLVLEKNGYKMTQTATMVVPKEGINDKDFLKNISFQVPSNIAYRFLSWAMGFSEDSNACVVAATITPPNTTMDNIPQGVAGVKVTLSPNTNIKPFYFGIFPWFHKTNPFIRSLDAISLDGGVAFVNVPPGDYIMEAQKEGVTFSKVVIKARKGVLVNASPPRGPTMLDGPKVQVIEKKPNYFNFFKTVAVIGVAAGGAYVVANALKNSY